MVVFWTPLRFVLPLLPNHYYRQWKRRRAPLDENACWHAYRSWVDLALAHEIGIGACLKRAERSWFPDIHRLIHRLVTESVPLGIVVVGIEQFLKLSAGDLDVLARHMSKRFSGGHVSADEMAMFLRGEQELIKGKPSEFARHAERLNARFGIRPFLIQERFGENGRVKRRDV